MSNKHIFNKIHKHKIYILTLFIDTANVYKDKLHNNISIRYTYNINPSGTISKIHIIELYQKYSILHKYTCQYHHLTLSISILHLAEI